MMLLKIAFRNIFRQKRRTALTAISIAGSYILMSMALSISDGTYSHMINLFTRDHTGHIQIHAEDYLHKPRIHKVIHHTEHLEAQLDSIKAVDSYAPRIFSTALAYGETKSIPVSIVGINPEKERSTSLLADKVKDGIFLSKPNLRDAHTENWNTMIGVGVAYALRLHIGDELILISQGADGSIANDVFTVSAIVGTSSSWEKMKVFLSLDSASEFLSLHNAVHQYSLLLKSKQDTREVAKAISAFLDNDRLTVSPWQEVEEVFYKSMRSDLVGNYVTQGVIVFIVCIGILNTILMTIMERTREFGVLKAIGTAPSVLFRLILTETALLALFSCAAGFIIALPINYWFSVEGIKLSVEIDMGGIIYDHMLGDVSIRTLLLPAVVVTGSAILVSLFPAMHASRLTPIDALRAS